MAEQAATNVVGVVDAVAPSSGPPSPTLLALARAGLEQLVVLTRKKNALHPVDRTAVLHAARDFEKANEALNSRKKLSDVKRAELRDVRERSMTAMLARLSTSSGGHALLLGLAATLQQAVWDLEKAEAGIAAVSRRTMRSFGDLRGIFTTLRGDVEPRTKLRLTRLLRLSPEELESVERSFRHDARALRAAQEVLGKNRESITSLLVQLKSERHRARAVARSVRSVRGKPSPVQSLVIDVAAAERTARLPRTPTVVRPRLRLGRAVPVVADESLGEGNAELGAHGERLIFRTIVWPAWVALFSSNRSGAVALLRQIAENYWTAEPELFAKLDSLAVEPLESARPLVEGLLWPATTAYGDILGFDMLQPSPSGTDWLCVEVKSTAGPPTAPFVLTRNEWATAQREGARYAVYRLGWAFEAEPALRVLGGFVGLVEQGGVVLAPSQYTVTI